MAQIQKVKTNRYTSKWDSFEEWDNEWASEWYQMTEIFDSIDYLKEKFKLIEVPYLLEIAQKQIILNLEKYAGLLNKVIIEKYK
ncbi:MAG: hypothetical protein GY870_00830 [archaeon]|nr:hypothetical protein [archaeon]